MFGCGTIAAVCHMASDDRDQHSPIAPSIDSADATQIFQSPPPLGALGSRENAVTASHSASPPEAEKDPAGSSRTCDFVDLTGAAPERIGQYEIFGEIARGGMGVVYRARQLGVNRMVALKMTLGAQFASTADRQRFLAEAQAAGKLVHPHIVPIYDVGDHDGQPYFSMGLIQGESLRDRLASGPLPPLEAARLLRIIAEAVHYAHTRGVIHRDLKPANVLVDRDGQPYITDFGLAKQTATDSGLTNTGQILGTPSFMPPEQAAGTSGAIGPHSDVYSLGATFYCLLTGRPPFQSAEVVDTLMQVLQDEPVPPRSLNANIPADLETICLKAMAKEASRRYASAADLAADLGRFEAGLPILARPTSVREKAWRWCRRNPALALAYGAATALLLATVVISAAFGFFQKRVADELAQRERQTFASLAESRRLTTVLALNEGRSLCERGDVAQGLHLFTQALESALPSAPNLERVVRVNLADWRQELRPLRRTLEHADGIHTMAVSPDGNLIAAALLNGELHLWDLKTGQRRCPPIVGSEFVYVLAFSPDNHWLACSDYSSNIQIRDTANAEPNGPTLRFAELVEVMTFSPDGRCLAIGCNDGFLRLYDPQTLELRIDPIPQGGAVSRIVFSPDSRRVAVCRRGATARFYDVASGKLIHEAGMHQIVENLAFRPDGRQFVTVGREPGGRLWDAESAQATGVLYAHPNTVREVTFSGDGRLVATGGDDQTARLWIAATGAPVGQPLPQTGDVVSLQFDKLGNRLLTGSNGGDAQIWETGSARRDGSQLFHRSWLKEAAFAREESLIVTGSGDGIIKLWAGASPERRTRTLEARDRIWGLSFSPDSQLLLASDHGGGAHLWHVADGTPVGQPMNQSRMIWDAAFSPDGALCATASDNFVAKLWKTRDASPLGLEFMHRGPVERVYFPPDGKSLITVSIPNRQSQVELRRWPIESGEDPMQGGTRSEGKTVEPLLTVAASELLLGVEEAYQAFTMTSDGTAAALAVGTTKFATIRIWRAGRTDQPPELQHNGFVHAMSFGPKGDVLLTAGLDRTVRLWNIATGVVIHNLSHPAAVPAAVISHDGTLIATGCSDRVVRLWSVQTGEPLEITLHHSDAVFTLDFSPDDQMLVCGTADGRVRLWDVETGQALGPSDSHSLVVTRVAFAPNGKVIASGSADARVHVRGLQAPWEENVLEIRNWIEKATGLKSVTH